MNELFFRALCAAISSGRTASEAGEIAKKPIREYEIFLEDHQVTDAGVDMTPELHDAHVQTYKRHLRKTA